jgi:hypothetical protein
MARRKKDVFNPFLNLAMLGMESQSVIWLRLMKIAAGGAPAQAESELMVSEKISAAMQAGTRLMLGASPDSIVSGYRRTVRANARRLSRPST